MRELASARSDTVMESPGWYWALVLSGDVLHPRNTLPTGAVRFSPKATRAIEMSVASGWKCLLAEVATMGPARLASSMAIGWSGMRIPTLSEDAVTMSGTSGLFFMMMVRGPGRNALMSLSAFSLRTAMDSIIFLSATATERAMSNGRFLAR